MTLFENLRAVFNFCLFSLTTKPTNYFLWKNAHFFILKSLGVYNCKSRFLWFSSDISHKGPLPFFLIPSYMSLSHYFFYASGFIGLFHLERNLPFSQGMLSRSPAWLSRYFQFWQIFMELMNKTFLFITLSLFSNCIADTLL